MEEEIVLAAMAKKPIDQEQIVIGELKSFSCDIPNEDLAHYNAVKFWKNLGHLNISDLLSDNIVQMVFDKTTNDPNPIQRGFECQINFRGYNLNCICDWSQVNMKTGIPSGLGRFISCNSGHVYEG